MMLGQELYGRGDILLVSDEYDDLLAQQSVRHRNVIDLNPPHA